MVQIPQNLIILAGPSGTGKTSMANLLTSTIPSSLYLEGDDLHPTHNVTKMSRGIPLTDADRAGWFDNISEALSDVSSSPSPSPRSSSSLIQSSYQPSTTIVLTCSALKRAHRRRLRRIAADNAMDVRFLFMTASKEELERRVRGRRGHYMKANMVSSQLAAMELPGRDETDAVVVDVEGLSSKDVLEKGKCILDLDTEGGSGNFDPVVS